MTIEFLYFEGCARAPAARGLLERCLERLGITAPVNAQTWDGPSPTIRIDGVDVMAASLPNARACRLDVPTEEKLLSALERARSKAS